MKNEFFINDRFRLLKILYDHQIQVGDVTFTPITQLEAAELMNCSKVKINKIIGELMERHYIKVYNNTKGRYVLTEDGLKAIKKYS